MKTRRYKYSTSAKTMKVKPKNQCPLHFKSCRSVLYKSIYGGARKGQIREPLFMGSFN